MSRKQQAYQAAVSKAVKSVKGKVIKVIVNRTFTEKKKRQENYRVYVYTVRKCHSVDFTI